VLAVSAAAIGLALFLLYVIVLPLVRRGKPWEEVRGADASSVIERIASHPAKHIVAALARDDGDAAVVSHAVTLAKAEKALLTLIHVVDSAPTQVYSDEVYDEHARADERYLADIAAELRALDVAVEIALPHGDPVTELASFAASHKVDLLVMGSHGHRLLGDILLGETVDPVRHRLDIPVLVVR